MNRNDPDRKEWRGALERLTGNEPSQMKERENGVTIKELRRIAIANLAFGDSTNHKRLGGTLKTFKHLDCIAATRCKASTETTQ